MTALPAEAQTKKWSLLRGLSLSFGRGLPKGLYARALIIIIAPIVLLQSFVAFVFMERHWQMVTNRLSKATVQDIAMLIDVYQTSQKDRAAIDGLADMAQRNLGLAVQVLPPEPLPTTRPKPFFDLLDRALADEIRDQIGKPFWIDTVGRSNLVEIRVRLSDAVFRVLARRNQTYASNSQIFLFWMIGASVLLLTVAILFLRNQIKPILRLADAADSFGKGHPVSPDFRPRGAREVRKAAEAFIEMRTRIEAYVEQRTTMLAGVSHDLRTILTRFRLQLALFEDTPEIEAMRADVKEMQAMLEDYVAFAKGDTGEEASPVALSEILDEVQTQSEPKVVMRVPREPIVVPLRRHAFKRAVTNLVNNATRFADNVVVTAKRANGDLVIEIDDDGPGIPIEEREEVFRPFYRLDDARNQDSGSTGTGLGLAIARDIARTHGGDITLSQSHLGGLRATVRMPI